MIEVKNVSFSYGSREILHDISFTAENGQLLSILGGNGVGKSTLFRCMLGLTEGYTGTVLLDGADRKSLSVRETARRAAFIPQRTSTSFNFSVEDIVLMGTTASLGSLRNPRAGETVRVEEALERIGIAELRHRCFHHLSGGEQQLVILARALAQGSNNLLLDEPTSALDFGNQVRVLTQLRALAREGYTVVQTTHNPEHAYTFSDRVIALCNGRVEAVGSAPEVMTEENIRRLYGVDVTVSSLFDDKIRVCTPKSLLE